MNNTEPDWTPIGQNVNPFYQKHRWAFQAAKEKPKPKRDTNPVAHCATCRRSKRERAFKIYDVANDTFFCNAACHGVANLANEGTKS